MKIGTANIQNFPDMPARDVAKDARTIAASCTLAGLQEIQPQEDTPVIAGALGDGWWMAGAGLEVPIVGRRDRWEWIDHSAVHFDRPKLPRPQNRHAGITTVILESVNRPGLPAFAVVNTHLVAGGHNGPRLPVIAQRWEVEYRILRHHVWDLHAQGCTVLLVGDLNDPKPPRLSPGFQWLSPQRGPDHIGQLVHTTSVQLGPPHSHKRIPLESDHALLVVNGPLDPAD